MKRITLSLVLASIALAAAATLFLSASPASRAAATVDLQSYEIDASHSTVLFAIKHFGVGKFYGRFNGIEGGYEMDGANLGQTNVQVDVAAGSIDTANKGRDRHLKASDFFDAGQFPKISFSSTSAKSTGEKTFELAGDLTMLGIKKSVTFSCEFIGEGEDQWNNYRTGFEARTTIKRSDFKMNYGLNNGALGDEVELIISVEGVKKKE